MTESVIEFPVILSDNPSLSTTTINTYCSHSYRAEGASLSERSAETLQTVYLTCGIMSAKKKLNTDVTASMIILCHCVSLPFYRSSSVHEKKSKKKKK